MTPSEHYREARLKANEIRASYNLSTPRVMVSDLTRIYREEGVGRPYYNPNFRGTRFKGAYFRDDIGVTVMINKKLIGQIDPKVFTLGHELKHHLMDDITGVCSAENERTLLEVGADVFAAELIYPEDMFVRDLAARSVGWGGCTPETVVKLKHETQTTLSHTGLALRATRLGYALAGVLDNVQWNNLRDSLYPEYTRWRRHR